MTAISNDNFVECAQRTDSEQRMQDLEECLAPMVRLALRKGVGLPEVVEWVQQTYAGLIEGTTPAPLEYYVPQITRLLCAQW
ncbi:MAG TPA: hypothetical protein VGZ47_14690 [Gemmataceae bacterium]|jgi:hypothetical protein|nr:hypothetical protein [Gemmataceae bacterium]